MVTQFCSYRSNRSGAIKKKWAVCWQFFDRNLELLLSLWFCSIAHCGEVEQADTSCPGDRCVYMIKPWAEKGDRETVKLLRLLCSHSDVFLWAGFQTRTSTTREWKRVVCSATNDVSEALKLLTFWKSVFEMIPVNSLEETYLQYKKQNNILFIFLF